MNNSTFAVDMKGLRSLQAGKPIWFVVRELIQNAFDEKITECTVDFTYDNGKAMIVVTDDNPTGFTDLSDAYTLFKDTRKRKDSKVRGRFNFGEKQVICMCDTATIITTSGSILFDSKGRHKLRKRRDKGSQVSVVIKMSKSDYQSCINYCTKVYVPKNIRLVVNHDNARFERGYIEPHKSFDATLTTEVVQSDVMRRVQKNTNVHVHITAGQAYIFEMGIPVCEIDCKYDVDVQQKIPLNMDRDNVQQAFLKTVYAEVLNQMFEDVDTNDSSDTWIRQATTSDRISGNAVKNIFNKRYGDKAVIANPFDKKSIDEAITNGYRVIYSSELNGDEHKKSREFGALLTSSEAFPVTLVGYTTVTPDDNQLRVAEFAKNVFGGFLSPQILNVMFIKSDADTLADFDSKEITLRFNLTNIPKDWFYKQKMGDRFVLTVEIIDLIIHELAHINGTHYEKRYLDTITRLGAQLAYKALSDPKYFEM